MTQSDFEGGKECVEFALAQGNYSMQYVSLYLLDLFVVYEVLEPIVWFESSCRLEMRVIRSYPLSQHSRGGSRSASERMKDTLFGSSLFVSVLQAWLFVCRCLPKNRKKNGWVELSARGSWDYMKNRVIVRWLLVCKCFPRREMQNQWLSAVLAQK